MQLPARTVTPPTASNPVLTTATVFDVRANPAVEGGTLLTLRAPKTSASAITAASNSELIALVQAGAAS
jgi:hypothetical protein